MHLNIKTGKQWKKYIKLEGTNEGYEKAILLREPFDNSKGNVYFVASQGEPPKNGLPNNISTRNSSNACKSFNLIVG